METLFCSLGLFLFVLAISSFVLVVRESLPFLDSEDQRALHTYWKSSEGVPEWRERDRAVKRAWSEHIKRFPKSRKRALFAALLVAAAVTVMFYPFWVLVGGH